METSTAQISGRLELRDLDPVHRLAEQLVLERGEPPGWRPAPHRDNLACAIIDAVMSPRISTTEVDRVVTRYQETFPDSVTSGDLAESFDVMSREGWRERIGTRHRVYANLEAPYKADVIALAARLLSSDGIQTRSDLTARAKDADIRAAWSSMPGHRSGSSWRHLLLISGFDRPLVCPLTRRFVRRALKGTSIRLEDAHILAYITDVAALLGTTPQQVDHHMWRAGAGAPKKVGPDEEQGSTPSALKLAAEGSH